VRYARVIRDSRILCHVRTVVVRLKQGILKRSGCHTPKPCTNWNLCETHIIPQFNDPFQRHTWSLRSTLCWDFTQRRMIVWYRRFGTTYRSHFQGSSSLRRRQRRMKRSSGMFDPWRWGWYAAPKRRFGTTIPTEPRSHLHHHRRLKSRIRSFLLQVFFISILWVRNLKYNPEYKATPSFQFGYLERKTRKISKRKITLWINPLKTKSVCFIWVSPYRVVNTLLLGYKKTVF
jgi:hypothetical protein